MKQITITVPDNCELKQDGNTYTIVEKEKKLTYNIVAANLFHGTIAYYIDNLGGISPYKAISFRRSGNQFTSKKQAEKLLAINKLMNVAKYLNDGWEPDWDYKHEKKYCIYVENEQIIINFADTVQRSDIYFKSKELAKQAIEILGEETIRLALCTDY